MFQRTRMTATMSQELIEFLTDGGRRDLTTLRLDVLEDEVIQLVDELTCRTSAASLRIRPAIAIRPSIVPVAANR